MSPLHNRPRPKADEKRIPPKYRLLKLGLSDDGEEKKWEFSMPNRPKELSVNRAHNVVVACYCEPDLSEGLLYEFTTDTALVRCIALPNDMQYPRHAIQLSTGDYAVCQWTSPGKISVARVNEVKASYESPDSEGQMEYPSCLAVTKNDDILVADEDNCRILAFTKRTRFEVSVQELVLPVYDGKGLHCPHAMFLDEPRGRLYVGELSGEYRVLVFDGVKL